jgi:hypothetical protein
MFLSLKKCNWGTDVWVLCQGGNEANVEKAARTIASMQDGEVIQFPSDVTVELVTGGA